MNSIVRYNRRPVSLLDNFDRVLDSFFNEEPCLRASSPAVDVREEEDAYVLEAELPGLTDQDIDVKVDGNLLTVSSKKEENKDEKKNGYILRERHSRSFARSFVLPEDVDRDSIKAGFKHGLLKLELPKRPETKPRAIEIKSE